MKRVEDPARLPVLHLVDALVSGNHLWGKERVVLSLMNEQRASGTIVPYLMTFGPSHLADLAAADGFSSRVICERPKRIPFEAVVRVADLVRRHGIRVIHSHGYKANIVGRFLRVSGRTPGIRLISTCHGWVESTPALRFYNELDRYTAILSDVTTVPDAAMILRFPNRTKTRHVPNGVPDIADEGADELPDVRRGAGFVAGTLGRVSAEKGIPEFLAAATACTDSAVRFVVAGVGELSARVAAAGDNVGYVGYVGQSHRYLAGLDVYVQSSRSEGLSLALLEAMRAGKPIVATDVGATRDAVTDGRTGILVAPERPAELLAGVLALKNDAQLAAHLGDNARHRFETDFRLRSQHDRFLQLYA